MTIPKNLQEKRDELAELHHDKTNTRLGHYKKGFNSAFNLLLPEIEKLKEALEWYATKGEGAYSDAKLYLRAESALHSWQEFLGEKSEGD